MKPEALRSEPITLPQTALKHQEGFVNSYKMFVLSHEAVDWMYAYELQGREATTKSSLLANIPEFRVQWGN